MRALLVIALLALAWFHLGEPVKAVSPVSFKKQTVDDCHCMIEPNHGLYR